LRHPAEDLFQWAASKEHLAPGVQPGETFYDPCQV